MPLARMSGRSDELRSVWVCVDSYDNQLLSGRLIFGQPQQERSFANLMQFLLEMEKSMDDLDLPPSAMEKRVFTKVEDPTHTIISQELSYKKNEGEEGKIATFKVRILFRQNASWQGSVAWIEGNTERTFRSVLELIMLIHSALCS